MEIQEDPYNDYNGELQIQRDRRTYEIKSTKSPPTSTTIIKDNKGMSTIHFFWGGEEYLFLRSPSWGWFPNQRPEELVLLELGLELGVNYTYYTHKFK